MNQRFQDIGAEKGLLSSLFEEPAVLTEITEIVSADDFAEPANGRIYEAMLELDRRNESINPVNVASVLRRQGTLGNVGGTQYLAEITDPNTLYNYDVDALGYAFLVREESTLRKLATAGQEIQALSRQDNGHTAEEAVSQAERLMRSLVNESLTTTTTSTTDALDSLLEETTALRDLPEGVISGIPSGFIDLDKLTNGWRGGQVVIVAGRPAMGKALTLDTPIPTPQGYKTMGELVVGDKVFGPDGTPTKVVAKSKVMDNRVLYRVSFDDGGSVVADADHQWVIDVAYSLPLTGIAVTVRRTVTTERLLRLNEKNLTVSLPKSNAVDFDVHHIGSDEAEAVRVLGSQIADRMLVEDLSLGYRPLIETASLPARVEFLNILRRSSDTLALDKKIASFVRGVAASAGWSLVPTINSEYVLTPSMDARQVINVTPAPTVPVQCIQVDNSTHTYLCGDSYAPTHNSTLALDFARHAAFMADKTVMFFSFEMSQKELLQRMLSAEARIELGKIISGKLTDEELTLLRNTSRSLNYSRIIFDDSPNSTMNHVRAAATRQKAKPEGLDMIVIDYLQLMNSGSRIESRQQEVSEISRAIKMLAKELGVPIIALSQLNRGPEQRQEKKPAMSDLRESGSLEQDADIVALVHRPEYYDKNDRPGQAFVDIAKHRGGRTEEVSVIPLLEYSMFANGTGRFPVSEPPPEMSEEEMAEAAAMDDGEYVPSDDSALPPAPPNPADDPNYSEAAAPAAW